MKTRLTSLVLLLALTGSAFAGMPLHSNEHECGMGAGVGEMDCCKAALMQTNTPEVTTARLCCVLSCSREGTAPSNSGVRIWTALQLPDSGFPPSIQPALPSVPPLHYDNHSHGPPGDSNPAYIRHLSLLI